MERLDYRSASPEALETMLHLEKFVRSCGLEESLTQLIKIRASQMNGCAYCVDMHTREARIAGETEQRLYLLEVWKETPLFTKRERAALAWTEVLTGLAIQKEVPDHLYENLHRYFSDKEMTNLTLAIITINGWNRFGVAFRPPIGKKPE